MNKLFFISFIISMASCQKKPNTCHCNISEISRNDSILSNPNLKEELIVHLKSFKQLDLREMSDETYRLWIHDIMTKDTYFYTFTKKSSACEVKIQNYSQTGGGWKRGMNRSEYFKNLKNNLNSERVVRIDKKDWSNFKKLIEEKCFWTTSVSIDRGGLDGSTWILEGYQPNQRNCSGKEYHAVSRFSPDSSDFRMICEKILTFAGE